MKTESTLAAKIKTIGWQHKAAVLFYSLFEKLWGPLSSTNVKFNYETTLTFI